MQDSRKEEVWSFSDLNKTAEHGITTLRDLTASEDVWPVMSELSRNVGHRLDLLV